MDADRHSRIKGLFLEICELPAEERPAALDRVCGEDRELRRELESLLGFHDAPETSSPGEPAGHRSPASCEALPERVGPYRVVRKLGEGGMGAVYEVRQEEPVRRRLALKVVKWGMDTEQVLARFESERQALALMNHPNVARVFDAGATDTGRPFFTMEYVDGEPIHFYCDRNRLSTVERLELFLQVCDGVQHAHQKGVIHRDIKSSNVLVRVEDGKPIATIIDFGVAKATQQRLTERSLYTERGMLIGTPEYMSPEQAEMAGNDIDTRTDVYSLGVVLYELLVGALPFDSKTLRAAGFDEIRRKIREEEPSKPSTRLSTLGDATDEAARHRRTDPAHLRRELSGDMDWITMKALEKDRTRRYASPADMAADIARHLRDEPVQASPPNTLYLCRKFVRRHRLGVTAGSIVTVAVILGLVMATAGLVRAKQAEQVSRKEAATARKVSELLVAFFEDLNPGITGYGMTPERMLDRGAERIRTELEDEPVLLARLTGTLGGAYVSLGNPEQGRELLEESVALCREHLPAENAIRVAIISTLGDVLANSGDLDRAQALHEEALEMRQRSRPANHVTLAQSHRSLGFVHIRRGEVAEARSHMERSQAILETQSATQGVQLASTLFWQAILDTEFDLDYAAARQRLERALAILDERPGSHPAQLGNILFWLGQTSYRMRDLEAARTYYDRALALQEPALGPDSYGVAMTTAGVGQLLAATGELETAREHLERALPILQKTAVGANADTARCIRSLAYVLDKQGDVGGARRMLEDSLERLERDLGPEHPELARTLSRLGYLEGGHGNIGTSRRYYRRSLEIQRKVWGDGHCVSSANLYSLACLAALEGREREALDLLRDSLDCGFDREVILRDPDLDSLRGLPEFEEMVEEVRRRLEG